MAKYVLIIVLILLIIAALAYIIFGNIGFGREMQIVSGKYDAKQTIERIKAILTKKSIPIFAEIDYSLAAKNVNLPLKKTVVIIFGSPHAGTPLMQKNREVAVILPLKILVWEGDDGIVRVGYIRPELIAQRYNLHRNKAITDMEKLLKEISAYAAGND